MFRVPSTDMGLMLTPVVSRPVEIFLPVEMLLMNLISSAVWGWPASNSTPAYRSSVFSRTITMSMFSYRERTPS